MKFHFKIVSTALLLGGVAAACFLKWGRGAKTGLEVIPRENRLGTVRSGDVLDFDLQIKNHASTEVRITDLRANCGCTQLDLQDNDLSPGETTRLKGSLDSMGRLGEFGSEISITGLDAHGKRCLARVAVKAKAVKAFTVFPSHVQENVDITQAPWSATLAVQRGELDLDWDNLQAEAGPLSCEVRKISDREFVVSVADSVKAVSLGSNRLTLALTPCFKGKSIAQEKTEIPILLQCSHPDFDIAPASIYLGKQAVGKTVEGEIKLRPAGHAAWKIKSVLPAAPSKAVSLVGQVDPGGTSVRYRCKLLQEGTVQEKLELVFENTDTHATYKRSVAISGLSGDVKNSAP